MKTAGFRTFDSLVSLPHSVTIFVPSTVQTNKVDLDLAGETLVYVREILTDLYGGSTQGSTNLGSWKSDVVGHVLENVVPVTVYVSELTREVQIEIMDIVEYIKRTMSQESVFMVVDGIGKLYF